MKKIRGIKTITTTIKLEQNIDDYINDKIIKYYEKFGVEPTTIIINKQLMGWLRKALMEKTMIPLKEGLNCPSMTYNGLNIIETMKDNVIEVY